MFAVSFRIPFIILNNVVHINGSLWSDKPVEKDSTIVVLEKDNPIPIGLNAEVIDSRYTKRDPATFRWEIYQSEK